MDEQFPARLQAARKAANLTQKDLADKVGVAVPTISSYETGTKEPGLGIAVKMAEALNVSLDELCRSAADTRFHPKTCGDIARFLAALMETDLGHNRASVCVEQRKLCEHPAWMPDMPDFTPQDFVGFVKDRETAPLPKEYEPTGDELVDVALLSMYDRKLAPFCKKLSEMYRLYKVETIDEDLYRLWLEREVKSLDGTTL